MCQIYFCPKTICSSFVVILAREAEVCAPLSLSMSLVLSLSLILFLVFAFVLVFASSVKFALPCLLLPLSCVCVIFVLWTCGHILSWPDWRRRSRLERALPQRSCLVLIRVSRLVLSYLILPSLVLPCLLLSLYILSYLILSYLHMSCLCLAVFCPYIFVYMSKLAWWREESIC